MQMVSISTATPTLTEGNLGSFTLSRSAIAGDLTVNLTTLGSSTSLTSGDYSLDVGGTAVTVSAGVLSVVIPDGQASVTLNMVALQEALAVAEGAETLQLNLAPGSDYSGSGSASITIVPNGFLVTNTNASGEGSLAQAISNANAIAGNDTIGFVGSTFTDATPNTITIGSELNLTSNITINGTGANLLTISGGSTSRVFNIASGANVTLNGLTVANGVSTSNGGGILNAGNLTIRNSVIRDNRASGASSDGGGIANLSVGTLILENSTVHNNTADDDGGGISNAGIMTLLNSTISGNTSIGSSATSGGGGLINTIGANATLTNSTISGNSARNGGAIRNDSTLLTLQSSTLTNNQSPNVGGLLNSINPVTQATIGRATLQNSIIARNVDTVITPFNFPDLAGGVNSFTDSGNNLIGVITGFNSAVVGSTQTGSIANPLNPLLAPLGDYGGTVQTHALLPGSSAIDAGNSLAAPAQDQRGIGRVGTADMGAFEYVPPNVLPTTVDSQITLDEDTVFRFGSNNFPFSDSDSGLFSAVRISQLPLMGELFLDSNDDGIVDSGEEMTAGTEIPIANLTQLKFIPAPDGNGNPYATFQFQVKDGTDFSSAATMTIAVNPVSDAAAISGDTSGSLTEDGEILTIGGVLTVMDADSGEARLIPQSNVPGNYGTFSLTEEGAWGYTADHRLQALTAEEQTTETFSVSSADGTPGTITVKLTGTNDAPILENPLTDQQATIGQPFRYDIPKETFRDIDAGDSLTLSATVATGAKGELLPSWLSFNPETGSFSATAVEGIAEEAPLEIWVTATDRSGASTSSWFTLTLQPSGDNLPDSPPENPGTENPGTENPSNPGTTNPGNPATPALGDSPNPAPIDSLGNSSGSSSGSFFGNSSSNPSGNSPDSSANASIVPGGSNAGQTGIPLPPIVFQKSKNLFQGTPKADVLNGMWENDTLKSGEGNDTIRGGFRKGQFGQDFLYGGDGNDILFGGAGNDRLEGEQGDDRLNGGRNRDLLKGGTGDDRLHGNAGNDILIGGAGNDTLVGGTGRDMFVLNAVNEGVDQIQGFAVGQDVVDLRSILRRSAFSGTSSFERYQKYVQLVQVGASTELRIDADGSNDTRFVTLARFQNLSAGAIGATNFVI
ncbi:VCBS domain-containing protein [Leptolyngbya ohadii]|uniref:VCBS domain-containing protein n=1 Tax=Leptolyngbya ohadii TaxID=1962290 RepID=UPI000B599AFD|nr:VCBS domain-containing protein [Leptolyngbya ohadii]